MDQKKAADILYQVLEQANAAGLFKRFADADLARSALNVLINIKPDKTPTDEKNP